MNCLVLVFRERERVRERTKIEKGGELEISERQRRVKVYFILWAITSFFSFEIDFYFI